MMTKYILIDNSLEESENTIKEVINTRKMQHFTDSQIASFQNELNSCPKYDGHNMLAIQIKS